MQTQKALGHSKLRIYLLALTVKGRSINNEFRSVFTIEDQKHIASMQPKPVSSETISEVDSVTSELVLKYLRKANKTRQRDDARLLRECENQ